MDDEKLKPLTDAEIAEMRQNMRHIEKVLDPEDAERIPRLLDEVTRARALLRRIEHNGRRDPIEDISTCPECEANCPSEYGHVPGCELAALIGK